MSERMWPIGTPRVIAHRAGGHEEHENSLVAFDHMLAKGFTFIETDAHASSDGVVVLFHDPVLDRTTHGTGKIEDKTWAELSQVRDHSGNRLVRLDETLVKFRGAILNIDAKDFHVVPHLARTIRENDAVGQVSLASFSETRLTMLRRMLPGAKSSLGTGAIVLLYLASRAPALEWLANFVPGPKRGVEAVQVPRVYGPITIVDAKFVALAHRRGYAVHVWTVNDEVEMLRLLELGVDGLVTDVPTTAKRVIEEWTAKRA